MPGTMKLTEVNTDNTNVRYLLSEWIGGDDTFEQRLGYLLSQWIGGDSASVQTEVQNQLLDISEACTGYQAYKLITAEFKHSGSATNLFSLWINGSLIPSDGQPCQVIKALFDQVANNISTFSLGDLFFRKSHMYIKGGGKDKFFFRWVGERQENYPMLAAAMPALIQRLDNAIEFCLEELFPCRLNDRHAQLFNAWAVDTDRAVTYSNFHQIMENINAGRRAYYLLSYPFRDRDTQNNGALFNNCLLRIWACSPDLEKDDDVRVSIASRLIHQVLATDCPEVLSSVIYISSSNSTNLLTRWFDRTLPTPAHFAVVEQLLNRVGEADFILEDSESEEETEGNAIEVCARVAYRLLDSTCIYKENGETTSLLVLWHQGAFVQGSSRFLQIKKLFDRVRQSTVWMRELLQVRIASESGRVPLCLQYLKQEGILFYLRRILLGSFVASLLVAVPGIVLTRVFIQSMSFVNAISVAPSIWVIIGPAGGVGILGIALQVLYWIRYRNDEIIFKTISLLPDDLDTSVCSEELYLNRMQAHYDRCVYPMPQLRSGHGYLSQEENDDGARSTHN